MARIYTHRVINLSGETIESRIDLDKVVAITRRPGEILVIFDGGKAPLKLSELPDLDAKTAEGYAYTIGVIKTQEGWAAAVDAAYTKLVNAWETPA